MDQGLRLLTKFLSKLLSCLKELIEVGGSEVYHSRAGPCSVAGKARHMTASGALVISALKPSRSWIGGAFVW